MNTRFSPLVALLTALAVAVTSCGKLPPPYTGPKALESGKWKQVKKQPPTYYPKGVSANAPTDLHDGFWVRSRKPDGPRFFIPADGVGPHSAEELITEAQASADRLPDPSEEREEKIENGIKTAVMVPLAIAVLAGILWLWAQEEDDDDWPF